MTWRVAYDLATDHRSAAMAETTRAGRGIAPEPAIVGTAEWWVLVGSSDLPLQLSEGVIEQIHWSGHGDFPEFTMRRSDAATERWERYGDHTLYVERLAVRVSWVEQLWARTEPYADTAKVVVRVEVEESDRRSAMEGRPAPRAP